VVDWGGEQVTSSEQVESLVAEHPIVAFYFSGPDCGVCRDLLPKLEVALAADYPKIPLIGVDASLYPAVAAQLQIFTVPTLLIFVDGKESIRRSRNFSPNEVVTALARPYALLLE